LILSGAFDPVLKDGVSAIEVSKGYESSLCSATPCLVPEFGGYPPSDSSNSY